MDNEEEVCMFQGCFTWSVNFCLAIKCTIIVLSIVFFAVPHAYGQSSLSPQSTQLNGISKYTHLGKEQFLAGLFSETLTSSSKEFLQAEEVKRLEVKVLAPSISPRLFRQLWIEAVAINASSNELNKHAQNLADFSNLLKPRMKAGDILMIDRTVDNGVVIILNNTHLGTVADKAFFDLLARAWVGAVPLSSKFRDELLSGGNVSVDLRSDYLSIYPSDERISDIKSFVANKEKSRSEKKSIVAGSSRKDKEPAKVAVAKAIPKKVTVSPPVVKAPTAIVKDPIKQPTVEKPVLASAKADAPEVVEADESIAVSNSNNRNASYDAEEEVVSDIDDEDSPDFVYTAERVLAKQLYIAKLSRWTFPFVQYPKSARRKGQEGSLVLKVVISRNGKVTDISVAQESGFLALDNAAITAVKKASPYPQMPEDIRGDSFSFSVPIAFSLKE